MFPLAQDMNYAGSTCICRVPKAQLKPGVVVECTHCGQSLTPSSALAIFHLDKSCAWAKNSLTDSRVPSFLLFALYRLPRMRVYRLRATRHVRFLLTDPI